VSARILVFAGSARRDSLNKKLARVAAGFAREAGAEVTFIDLDDYPMPVYHGDLESAEGMPANGLKLRELFIANDALLIVSPENNQSMTSLLKNTIDWLSRSIGDGKGANSGLAPFRGKVAAMMAASPGAYGRCATSAAAPMPRRAGRHGARQPGRARPRRRGVRRVRGAARSPHREGGAVPSSPRWWRSRACTSRIAPHVGEMSDTQLLDTYSSAVMAAVRKVRPRWSTSRSPRPAARAARARAS
jgi:NAD(P)H-dependent FMN reductase